MLKNTNPYFRHGLRHNLVGQYQGREAPLSHLIERKNSCSYQNINSNKRGFTLIEVLVALAIVSIALTAIMKSSLLTTKNTSYLHQKIMAQWIASRIINQVRLGILTIPFAPDKYTGKTTVLNEPWSWQAYLEPTANTHIQRITVTAYATPSTQPVARWIGYRHVE